MIFYKISLSGTTQQFDSIDQLNNFVSNNPEWGNLPIEEVDIEIPSNKIVPQSVPLWCLRTVLRASNLLQPVKDTIASMPEGSEKIAAEEGLEYANTVLRNSPTTLFIQSVLQLTSNQVDDIFINADKIEA